MARRRPRTDIILPHYFSRNSFYPKLAPIAADLRTQEMLGGFYNLPRRWKSAYKTALQEVMREKLEQSLLTINNNPKKSTFNPFAISVPINEDEMNMLEWFRTEGHTKE